jgi:hypothetical protein
MWNFLNEYFVPAILMVGLAVFAVILIYGFYMAVKSINENWW